MSRSTITETDHEDKFFDGRPSRVRHHQISSSKAPDQMSMRSHESCQNFNFNDFSAVPTRQFYHQGNGSQIDEMSSVRSISMPPRKIIPRNFAGSYENYDSPRILSPSSDGNQEENYDRPRSIKMYLDHQQPTNGQQQQQRHLNLNGDNGNYSKPSSVHCCVNNGNGTRGGGMAANEDSLNCTCHKVMSWADNWIPCKRGNGIENTGIVVSKIPPLQQHYHPHHQVIAQEPVRCKLNDFSHTSSQVQNGKAPLYAFVDTGKKNQSKRIMEEMQQPAYEELRCSSINPNANYANLNFEKSLEMYENVREVMKRENALTTSMHVENGSHDNYILMENNHNVPDYIPMHAPQQQQQQQQLEIPPPAPAKDYEVIVESVVHVEEKQRQKILKKSRSLNDLKNCVVAEELKKSPSCSNILILFKQDEIHMETAAIYENVGENRTAIVESIEQQLKAEHVYVECDSTQANRDSSGSNDSGVSASSSTIRNKLIDHRPAISAKTKRRLQLNQQVKSCVHASLIRKSRSFDPFGDSIHFQFNPCMNNNNRCNNLAQNQSQNKCPSLGAIMTGNIDTNSTSSGTSDMSDYIETLSLSSYSSYDADALRYVCQMILKIDFLMLLPAHRNRHVSLHHTINTMRPRSGKEYEKFDRSALTNPPSSLPPIKASTSSLNPN